MRLLDLFCGQGGTTAGLQRAGHDVTGVDRTNHGDRYPGTFIQADALTYLIDHGHRYDGYIAGPPCQGYTIATAGNPTARAKHQRLIAATRELLILTGKPWVIENVQQARSQMVDPIMLCGRMFNLSTEDEDGEPLALDRHRLFESNIPLVAPEHPKHDGRQVAGVYTGGRPHQERRSMSDHFSATIPLTETPVTIAPLDVPCRTCKAPVGRKCRAYRLDDGGSHNARYDDSTDKFLVAHGYEPLRGKGKSI